MGGGGLVDSAGQCVCDHPLVVGWSVMVCTYSGIYRLYPPPPHKQKWQAEAFEHFLARKFPSFKVRYV